MEILEFFALDHSKCWSFKRTKEAKECFISVGWVQGRNPSNGMVNVNFLHQQGENAAMFWLLCEASFKSLFLYS